MKLHTILLIGGVSASTALSVPAAGAFKNLGFETATLPPFPPGQPQHDVPIARALPGWTGFRGTDSVNTVWYNDLSLGSVNISILDRSGIGENSVIEGNYTVVLQPGAQGFEDRVGASISQVGMVPLDAESIRIKALAVSFSVTFAGQELSLLPLENGANYTLYGADIARFAGQSGELAITALPNSRSVNFFDSIAFSPSQVPEPSVVGLLGVGLLMLAQSLVRRQPSRASAGKISNAQMSLDLRFPNGFEGERACEQENRALRT